MLSSAVAVVVALLAVGAVMGESTDVAVKYHLAKGATCEQVCKENGLQCQTFALHTISQLEAKTALNPAQSTHEISEFRRKAGPEDELYSVQVFSAFDNQVGNHVVLFKMSVQPVGSAAVVDEFFCHDYLVTDFDECASDELNLCSKSPKDHVVCKNEPLGSYSCVCESAGFRLASSHPCHVGHTECYGSIRCEDIDECDAFAPTHNCAAHAKCTNTLGGFTCECERGFTDASPGDTRGTNCVDVDECATGAHDCVAGAEFCTNTVGGFTCACPPSFQPGTDGRASGTGCRPIAPCDTALVGELCVPSAVCALCNLDDPLCMPSGSVQGQGYRCQCQNGLIGTGRLSGENAGCSECLEDGSGCPAHASCKSDGGKKRCVCNEGFVGDGRVCVPVDPCETPCPVGEFCDSSSGARVCSCIAGTQRTGEGSCVPATSMFLSGPNPYYLNQGDEYIEHGITIVTEVTAVTQNEQWSANYPAGLRKRLVTTPGRFVVQYHLITDPEQVLLEREVIVNDCNECAGPAHCGLTAPICPEFSACSNTNGSFECICEHDLRPSMDASGRVIACDDVSVPVIELFGKTERTEGCCKCGAKEADCPMEGFTLRADCDEYDLPAAMPLCPGETSRRCFAAYKIRKGVRVLDEGLTCAIVESSAPVVEDSGAKFWRKTYALSDKFGQSAEEKTRIIHFKSQDVLVTIEELDRKFERLIAVQPKEIQAAFMRESARSLMFWGVAAAAAVVFFALSGPVKVWQITRFLLEPQSLSNRYFMECGQSWYALTRPFMSYEDRRAALVELHLAYSAQ